MRKAASISLISFLFLFPLFAQDEIEPVSLQAEPFWVNGFFADENSKRRAFGLAFSPDGRELYFSYIKRTPENPDPPYEIKSSKLVDTVWAEPSTAPFSGVFSDVDICFSPNGEYLIFASDRPDSNSAKGGIFYMTKESHGWSEPISAGSEVNVRYEAWPTVSSKGNLFFQSHRDGGYGGIDIYRAEWKDGQFINVQNLGSNINTAHNDYHPSIAPDESYILISAKRPEDGNLSQVYISFQIGDNVWTKAKLVGEAMNEGLLRSPTFSPDGKYLFFNKKDGLYRTCTSFVEELRAAVLEQGR